ncbi:IS607 family transposase [Chloracidobacterium thermophilum]|jgi:predicted site-specific integrase-resolvase|uniref:IS607 family transposase n=1 Tax=Chloracidobacterium thermophilum TaxID=458033 RepID=UPI001BB2D78A|nr:IS607 family transposase [Chloracidobacterium thermophilum]QUV79968.1 IS607 family transposase [Chloracidobacterium thermophilum]
MTRYVKPREAADYFGVCLHTLRRWEQKGWINATRTPSGRARRYDLDSYIKTPRKVKRVVLYARVSSRGQKPDLERQIARLVNLYPGAEVVGEVGGGLNFKRPKFLALLERVRAGDVGTIVVAHRDRLCRFGFEFVEWYCHQYGCEVLVLDDDHLSPQQELVEDILTILHCFSSRLYGLRKYRTAIEKDTDLSRTSAG